MLKELFTDHYDELLELLNTLKVGVYITDGTGLTIMVNDVSCRTGGLTREEVTGQNMQKLEKEGYVKQSATLKAIKSNKPESILQELGDGGENLVEAQPVFENGRLTYIICTESDVTEAKKLRILLRKTGAKAARYEEEIKHLQNRNIEMSGDIIASDAKSKMKIEEVKRVAALDITVLLSGESGTGKEIYANLIYKNSARVGKPFIKVNCAAIPENLIESEMFGYERGAFTGAERSGKMGYFELANGGTLFLDEIGDLPIHLQPKLLRVLQEKEIMRIGGQKPINIDVRLIAATNVDLLKEVENGDFRKDLYYRLAIMPIELSPLRERKGDIKDLAVYFTKECNRKYRVEKTITEGAIDALKKYNWPGNVRELQNVIERCVISFGGEIINRFQIERLLYPRACEVLSGNGVKLESKTLDEIMSTYEKQILTDILEQSKNASEAANKLGIDRSTMSRKMQKYKLV